MPHLILLRLHVSEIVFIGVDFNWHPLDYLNPVALQTDNLLGIIGHQLHFAHSQIHKNLGPDAVVS